MSFLNKKDENMNFIKNLRERKKMKLKNKYKIYCKKKIEEGKNKLIAEHANEIKNILKRKDRVIADKIEWFENELKSTREQEEKKYNIRLEDKNNEIKRLRDFIERHKKLFDNIESKENDVEHIIKKVNHKFERGLHQIAEGFQTMQLAQKDIDDCRRKYIKTAKLREVIEP